MPFVKDVSAMIIEIEESMVAKFRFSNVSTYLSSLSKYTILSSNLTIFFEISKILDKHIKINIVLISGTM